MTEEKELKIPFEEANRISIECKFGAESIIDIRNTRQWPSDVLRCTACATSFDSKLASLLRHLSEAQTCSDTLGKAETHVFLRIRVSTLT